MEESEEEKKSEDSEDDSDDEDDAFGGDRDIEWAGASQRKKSPFKGKVQQPVTKTAPLT
jgi:hypothetical protein